MTQFEISIVFLKTKKEFGCRQNNRPVADTLVRAWFFHAISLEVIAKQSTKTLDDESTSMRSSLND